MQIDVDIEYYSVEIRQFTSSDPVKVECALVSRADMH